MPDEQSVQIWRQSQRRAKSMRSAGSSKVMRMILVGAADFDAAKPEDRARNKCAAVDNS
jgi:hypothetical protein